MKKILQRMLGGAALATMLLCSVPANAAEKSFTEDFKSIGDKLTTSTTTPKTTASSQGVDYTFENCAWKASDVNRTYVMLNKNGSSITFTLPYDLKSFKIKTSSFNIGAKAALSLEVGETTVVEAKSVSTSNATVEFSIPEEYQQAGTPYVLKNSTSANAHVASITYTVIEDSENTVATPVITFDETEHTVTITCATDGASIYYTTDEATPTTESNLYSDAFTIEETTTVKAIAVKEGMNNSEVVTEICTISEGGGDDPETPGEAGSATFDFQKEGAYGIGGSLTTSEGTFKQDNCTMNITVLSGTGYRIYNADTKDYKGYELRIQAPEKGKTEAATITISSPANTVLKSIEFMGEAVGFNGIENYVYTPATKTGVWTAPETVSSNTTSFTTKAQARIRTIKVIYDGETAVETIDLQNEAPVFFNLQGVRIAEPQHGIYIRVQNGKAVKIAK